MMVLIMERVSPSLRGQLTRWLLEPKAGVFVGNVSAMVRQKLWEKSCQSAKDGACMLIWSSNTEQGFRVDFWGDTSRHVTDWEGLKLITRPHPK
ncbi:MAG TPA: type I-E CRISPR-associated endoribonuclease Cas2 [Candidatus Hydrogenedentes bacterium]|nr:type I-E CRISPR-associated endoribonuclease Cas2 [Candidatus Hydrogenedentota bacterium]